MTPRLHALMIADGAEASAVYFALDFHAWLSDQQAAWLKEFDQVLERAVQPRDDTLLVEITVDAIPDGMSDLCLIRDWVPEEDDEGPDPGLTSEVTVALTKLDVGADVWLSLPAVDLIRHLIGEILDVRLEEHAAAAGVLARFKTLLAKAQVDTVSTTTIAHARREGPHYIVDLCPFCGETHLHGVGDDAPGTANAGTHAAHCVDGGGQYELIVGGKATH